MEEEWLLFGGVAIFLWALKKQCSAQNTRQEDDDDEESGRSPYGSTLLTHFENLAKSLQPSDQFLADATSEAHQIYNYLLSKASDKGIKLVRYKVAGSVGKGTCISYLQNGRRVNPDIDLVIILDNAKSPFTKELKIFEDLLRGLDKVSQVKRRKYSIQLNIWRRGHGDIKMDLLVAENRVNNRYPWREEDVGEVEALVAKSELDERQRQALAQTQTVSQEENKLISSAFAEKTVQVIGALVEDEFVLDCVLLAKYWNVGIDLSQFGYVPARSCVIETIAIHTQLLSSKEGTSERCLISGFRRFLEAVSDIRTLEIYLTDEGDTPDWKPKKPVVKDPVNPWNNLTEGIPGRVLDIWQDQAKKGLEVLAEFRNNDGSVENAVDGINKIFNRSEGEVSIMIDEWWGD